jgi:hypothetical protein
MSDSRLKQAIAIRTIPILWQRLGLPGQVSGNCVVCSPLRDDKHPSFSIFAGGTRWKDHGTGLEGDSFNFYQEIMKMDARSAWRPFIDLSNNE